MKQIKWVMAIGTILMLTAAVFTLVLLKPSSNDNSEEYIIDANRIYQDIQSYIEKNDSENGTVPDLRQQDFLTGKGYSFVKAMSYWGETEMRNSTDMEQSKQEFFEGKNAIQNTQVYLLPLSLEKTGYSYVRFEYINKEEDFSSLKRLVLIVILSIWVLFMGVLLYVMQNILRPFHKIEQLPYELAKGHLSIELKESKYHMFGKFIWGLDALRETLKNNRVRQLELEKEKKMMILSVSHDIKTPLSSIYLYDKALKEGLYEEEKRQEIYDKLQMKAQQIERFVAEIEKTSTEDLLQLPVSVRDTYVHEFMDAIKEIYQEKFTLLHTDFVIERYSDKLVQVDRDRMIEIIENILENAIKYGDGRKISITSTEEEYCLLITICNSGSPVEEKDFPHLFESFWRGQNGKNQNGSGLGLYICKELMRKMNGDVYASRTDNTMSFTLVIPEA